MAQSEGNCAQSAPAAQWPTHTHWSVVLAAADPAAPGARKALEDLCRAYWYPVYAYIRRRGYDRPDAEDLTQAFFLHLIETQALSAATPARGRFRAFLRTSVAYFLVSKWRHANALKRGGAITFVSWDGRGAEQRYQREAVCDLTPERLFERSWADTLLQRVLDQLKAELARAGEGPLFEATKQRLVGDAEAVPYADLAPRLGKTESALRKTVQRLRGRYGVILRREVAHTVASPNEVDDELRHLLTVVSA